MNGLPQHSVSVAGVAFDDLGRVLIIKRRDNGEWQAPGGILERAETFEQGVMREVLEETGVQVEVQALTGAYKNLARGVVALVYRCKPVAGLPVPTEEGVEAVWVDVEDALARMMPAFAIRVRDAIDASGAGAFSRTHDGRELVRERRLDES